MKRPQGDQRQLDEFEAWMVAHFLNVSRSQTSMSPARLPKPAMAINRPCGEYETKLRGAAGKSYKGLHL
jgi:hypothetical protein